MSRSTTSPGHYFRWAKSSTARRAFGVSWLLQCAFALVLALPLAASADAQLRYYPDANQALLAPGGELLLDFWRQLRPSWQGLIPLAGLGVLVAAALRVVPLTGCVVAISRPEQRWLPWLMRLALALPRQAALSAVGWGLQAGWLGLVYFARQVPAALLPGSPGQWPHDLAWLVTLGLLALPAALIQPGIDLARFYCVHRRARVWSSLTAALELVNRAPLRLFASYLVPLALGYAAALGCGYWGRLVVTRATPAQVAAAMLVHGLGLLLLSIARMAWLGRAHGWVVDGFERAPNQD